MNNNRILFLTNPAQPHEAVCKNDVDRKFDTPSSFLSYEGHIPSLERALSKTGFIVDSSSRLDAVHQGWAAFNKGRHGEWVTAGEGKDAWIQISCSSPVRIWKIGLTGRRSNRERITSWKLCGVVGETCTDIYTSDTTLGSTMQEFLVSPRRDYSTYRLMALSAEPGNVGLSYFQIFIKSYHALRY